MRYPNQEDAAMKKQTGKLMCMMMCMCLAMCSPFVCVRLK